MAADPMTFTEDAWRAMPDSMAVHLSEGTWTAPPHLQLLSYFLYLASVGIVKRLVVQMPPGHGKSELISHWYPVWLLDHLPDTRIILSSYESTLAEEWGKAVRLTLEEHEGSLACQLRPDSQAANRWRTEQGGGMWTVGAGGAITGRRARVFIIDDPHKNFDEAHSETIRNKVWNWYTSTARTRLLPGGSIVVVQTRWHDDDLAGRLLELDGRGPNWLEVRLPAVAETDETIETVIGKEWVEKFEQDGIPVPEWHRNAGEALWPDNVNPMTGETEPWYNLEELEGIRADVGEYVWSGLYQQRPTTLVSEMFDPNKWNYCDALPAGLQMVRRWDLAASEKQNADWTAGVLIGRDAKGHTYIADVRRIRENSESVERFLQRTAAEDRTKWGSRHVSIKIEQEPGASGKAYAEYLIREVMSGYDVQAKPSTGNKFVSALPLSAQQQAGNVYLLRQQRPDGLYGEAAWFDEFREEARLFPNGRHDDMVDAASKGFLDLSTKSKRRSRARGSAGISIGEFSMN